MVLPAGEGRRQPGAEPGRSGATLAGADYTTKRQPPMLRLLSSICSNRAITAPLAGLSIRCPRRAARGKSIRRVLFPATFGRVWRLSEDFQILSIMVIISRSGAARDP